MKYYMQALLAVAGIATAATVYFGQEKPLEPGHYRGKIDGQPAVLQVVYSNGDMRDCYLTTRILEGNKGSETIEDILCNEKGISFTNKDQNNTPAMEEDLKNKIRTAKSWVHPDNKVSAEEARNYLIQ